MTDKEISHLLHNSETKFLRCWKVLESMKQYKIDKDDFPHFQPVLAEAIYDLSAGYNKISQVRNKLILKKSSYSPQWFAKRQKLLAHRQKVLNEAISIGKTIGDAFAWFFYQRDRELLLEHAKHPSINHMSTGLGGIGEKEFIKNTKRIGPFMVLYHGTTTILRIGDITLIDLERYRVAAIGELKTGPAEPGKLNMTLQFVGLNENLKPFINSYGKTQTQNKSDKKLPPTIQARLDKQIKNILKTLNGNKEKTNTGTITKEERRSVHEFEKLVSNAKVNEFTSGQLGRGLLCTIYKHRVQSLALKLTPKKKIDFRSRTDDLPKKAISIMVEKSPHNSIIMSPLVYSRGGRAFLMPGTIPVFWWPINIEILKKLIFQDIIVINIYNPAHFIHALESSGYKMISEEKNRRPKMIKKIGKTTIELQGIPYFLRLIHHDMFDEDQIIEFIAQVEETIKEKRSGGVTKVNIVFNHVLNIFQNINGELTG